MGRYSKNPAYSHSVQRITHGCYRLYWVCDRYYDGSRLRHPVGYSRLADEAGARRFASRHGLTFPEMAQKEGTE